MKQKVCMTKMSQLCVVIWVLQTSPSQTNRFGLVLYLSKLKRKAKAIIVCARVGDYMHPFPACDYVRTIWAYVPPPRKKALCKWVQLLALLVHVLLGPFRSSGTLACYKLTTETFVKIPKSWLLVPRGLGVSIRFLLLSISPFLLHPSSIYSTWFSQFQRKKHVTG